LNTFSNSLGRLKTNFQTTFYLKYVYHQTIFKYRRL